MEEQMKEEQLEAIVICDLANAIGRGGDQPYYIANDLKAFQKRTMGHGLICGRKTLLTFPRGLGLKGRTTFVLSRRESIESDDPQRPTKSYPSIEDLLEAAKAFQEAKPDRQLFVIGGASVYEQFITKIKRIYLTRVHAYAPNADRYFPDLKANHFVMTDHGAWLYDAENRVYYRLEIWDKMTSSGKS